MPPFLKAHADGTLLFVKVQPRASKNEIGGIFGNELKLKVTAPPVDSAANEAVIEFLAEVLGCARSAIVLVRGQASRHKTILLRGLELSDVAGRIGGPTRI